MNDAPGDDGLATRHARSARVPGLIHLRAAGKKPCADGQSGPNTIRTQMTGTTRTLRPFQRPERPAGAANETALLRHAGSVQARMNGIATEIRASFYSIFVRSTKIFHDPVSIHCQVLPLCAV